MKSWMRRTDRSEREEERAKKRERRRARERRRSVASSMGIKDTLLREWEKLGCPTQDGADAAIAWAEENMRKAHKPPKWPPNCSRSDMYKIGRELARDKYIRFLRSSTQLQELIGGVD